MERAADEDEVGGAAVEAETEADEEADEEAEEGREAVAVAVGVVLAACWDAARTDGSGDADGSQVDEAAACGTLDVEPPLPLTESSAGTTFFLSEPSGAWRWNSRSEPPPLAIHVASCREERYTARLRHTVSMRLERIMAQSE